MMRRVGLIAALAVLALPALVSCGSGSEPIDGDALLTAASKKLSSTSGIELSLTGSLPKGVSGLTGATGVATKTPAFEGELSVIASSIPVKVDVIAVDGSVYAVLPFTTDYAQIDPADYSAPDPAVLMNRSEGIPTWLEALVGTDITAKEVREGSDVLSELQATLRGEFVAALIPSADASADFSVVLRIDSDDQVRFLSVSGPFYPDVSDVTYEVTITAYDVSKAITAP